MITKKSQKFECAKCDYICSRKNDFEKHILTQKHRSVSDDNFCRKKSQKVANGTENAVLSFQYNCDCGKNYTHKSNLSRHKKACNNKNDIIKQLIFQNQQLIFENKEIKDLILEQNSKLIEQNNKICEIATKPSTINNNCHNKQFNLNLFLNEKCKNAMNMKDFINSIEIMDEDFENIGRLGYVQGISNIFLKGLKDLDETARPLHCSDIKRDILYIKEGDVWNKDENNVKIMEAINGVSHKNVKYIPIWRDANPDAIDGTTKKNDQYMQIVNQVMTSITPDDPNGINKIIRNVASRVVIDKDSFRL